MFGMGGFDPAMLQRLMGGSVSPGGFPSGAGYGGIGQGPMGRGGMLQLGGPQESLMAQNPMGGAAPNPLGMIRDRMSQGIPQSPWSGQQQLPQQRGGGMPIVQQGGPQGPDRQRRKPQLY